MLHTTGLTFMIKKDKGVALLLTLFVLIALSTMSVAMLSIIQTSAKNSVRIHRSIATQQAAEFGIEDGKLELVERFTSDEEIVTNEEVLNRLTLDVVYAATTPAGNTISKLTKSCLALHGYTTNEALPAFTNIHYSLASSSEDKYINDPENPGSQILNPDYKIYTGPKNFVNNDPEFGSGKYTYIYFLQRVGMDTTFDGFNFAIQSTYVADTIAENTDFDGSRRIFYRIISCGLGPNQNYIVPMQAYFSIGGQDGDTNFTQKNIINEGFYRP